jgi:hypothetical protein
MPTEHRVADGECIYSIAQRYGLAPDTLWNHPANQDLKDARGDQAILEPGDVVTVPDRREKRESCGGGARHRFRRKGLPARLRVRMVLGGEACADEPYTLDIDGRLSAGRTDDDGHIDVPIRPGARRGVVTLRGEEFTFDLGTLHPADTDAGAIQRLENLGYLDEEDEQEGDEAAALAEAVKRFQEEAGLDPTGQVDDATRQRLVEAHGS